MATSVAALALVAVCGPGPAAAQDTVLRISLDDAQARALGASHRLAEARAREAAGEAVVAAREAASRPILTALAGYTRTNHVTEFIVPGPTGVPRVLYPDVPNNYTTRLVLQWPIYTGGRTDALERAARAEAAAAGADVAVAQSDLALEVSRAFWALVTARATVGVLEQGVARAQAHVRDVRQRFDAGLVPPNEVSSAEAQESRARMLLIQARNLDDVSSASLARLVGSDLAVPIEPAAALDVAPPLARSIEALIAAAGSTRRERVAMERRIEAAEEQLAAARAARRPTISVTGGVDYARPNPRIFPRADRWDESWEGGVNVSWSLWDGGRSSAEAAQVSSLAEASRRRLAEFDSVLAVEVRQRALEIESGRAAVEAAGDAVRAAEEARRVVEERYRAGVVSQTDVLDAEFALLQAQLDRTQALADVRFAEARLARAVGP